MHRIIDLGVSYLARWLFSLVVYIFQIPTILLELSNLCNIAHLPVLPVEVIESRFIIV